MKSSYSTGSRLGRWCKNLALLFLLSGFAFVLGGEVLEHWLLFKAGLFIFLMGIPLFFIGWAFGRLKR